jgi:RNA polymerase sigma-70 factor, ECF subfamily
LGLAAPASVGLISEAQRGEGERPEDDQQGLDCDDDQHDPPDVADPVGPVRGRFGWRRDRLEHGDSLPSKTKAERAKRTGPSATLQNVQMPLAREVPLGFTQAEWVRACEASYPKVYRALVAMGASPEDAADALQDAFEDALRERGPVARPDGWLFVVACRAWKRHRWRHRIFRPLAALRGAGQVMSRDGEIDLLVELAKLTERQREVIVSRYVLGLSQAETADLLDIAPGTVAATAHQAASRLRERLLGGPK